MGRFLIGLGASALVLAAGPALAGGHGGRGHDYARVVDVDPIVTRHRVHVPVEQCWREVRYREAYVPARRDTTGAAIVGGVAGAVIGSQFGSGDGRTAATLAGAALGAVVGREAARSGDGYRVDARPREVERCRTVHETRHEERVVAYRVTYAWRGRHYVTEMPHDPGRRIRVGVDVYPLR